MSSQTYRLRESGVGPGSALGSASGLPRLLRRWRICLQCRRLGFDPWVGKVPWQRERQPAPGFLPGESHGQRSLVSCSPWGRKETGLSNQQAHFHFRRFWCSPKYKHHQFRRVKKSCPEPVSSLNYLMSVTQAGRIWEEFERMICVFCLLK